MATIADALTSLRKHFGFDQFRAGQTEVISAILEGKNAVVVMPTGSGKSLCYQLPAMMMNGATLVVSPLIALMKDQVDALVARGLPATFINSSITSTEQHQRIDALRRGQFKIVYVAPERFRSQRFVEALKPAGISLFAVDEAHCISTWGHDFRPDYLRLKFAIAALGKVQTIALTATATPYVRSDIIQQLGLVNPPAFVSGFDRPNLSIEVIHTEKEREKAAHIKRLALTHKGSGIIYASTRKAVEQVAATLQAEGLSVSAYHAGMPDAVRIRAQDDFMSGRTQMIVATNAFGMGIDKRDIRFVAHYQMPGSIEAYYQEIGRAGRDDLPSDCVLLFNYADKNTHDFFIEGSYPDLRTVQSVYDALIATGEKRIEISTRELAARSDASEMAVNSALYMLERAEHIARVQSADPLRRGRAVVMLDPSACKLRLNPSEVAGRAALERRKLREILNFCYSDACFRAHILDYFGDRHHARACGTCGNCSARSYAHTLPQLIGTRGTTQKKKGKRAPATNDRYLVPRPLTADETLLIRKILACATRMKGRFGKNVLAATLRGSSAKNLLQARLHELSTYGLLRHLKQDEIVLYIDALIIGRCLRLTPGEYPLVVITEFGDAVMREREVVELALPSSSRTSGGVNGRAASNRAIS